MEIRSILETKIFWKVGLYLGKFAQLKSAKNNQFSSEKVDYRGTGTEQNDCKKTTQLENRFSINQIQSK